MSSNVIVLDNSNNIDPGIIRNLTLNNTHDIDYYARTKELIQLLYDIGATILDPNTGRFELEPFLIKNLRSSFVPRLLGYIAEGVIVRECNEDEGKNKKWANRARYLVKDKNAIFQFLKSITYEKILDSPSNYIAVGTGFRKTLQEYPSFYSTTSPRDICWIKKNDKSIDLSSTDWVVVNQRTNAGIQVKVSNSGGAGAIDFFKKKPYWKLYPVVYFDLGDDFHIVKDKLMSLSAEQVAQNSLFSKDVKWKKSTRQEIIDMMFIRGKDIASDIHEELLYYRSIFKRVENKEINLSDIANEDIVLGILTEYLSGQQSKFSGSILTLSY